MSSQHGEGCTPLTLDHQPLQLLGKGARTPLLKAVPLREGCRADMIERQKSILHPSVLSQKIRFHCVIIIKCDIEQPSGNYYIVCKCTKHSIKKKVKLKTSLSDYCLQS